MEYCRNEGEDGLPLRGEKKVEPKREEEKKSAGLRRNMTLMMEKEEKNGGKYKRFGGRLSRFSIVYKYTHTETCVRV